MEIAAELTCQTVFEGGMVCIRAAVNIRKPAAEVFACFGNLLLDKQWRKEIRRCEQMEGGMVRQFSYLSAREPAFCQDYQIEKNDFDAFELIARSVSESRHFQDSFRKVEAISPEYSRAFYAINFDRAILKTALGFDIPDFLLRFQMNRVCRKYLKELRKNLEKPNSG